MDIWKNNPYVSTIAATDEKGQAQVLPVGYPLIHKSNQCGLHFINGFIQDFNKKLGLNIKLSEFKPDVYMTEEEINNPLKKEKYWIITSGGKLDFTAKWWVNGYWQEVVNALKDKINFVQLGADVTLHPRLDHTEYLVGQTPKLRDAMKYMYHCDGIITIVTCFMHFAAAFNKPCITVAGGREPYTWEAYDCYTREVNMKNADPNWKEPENDDFVPHKYLHTMGLLSCCLNRGCWKSKIVGPGSKCLKVTTDIDGKQRPVCLDMIKPAHVIEAVEQYLDDYKPNTDLIETSSIELNSNYYREPPIRYIAAKPVRINTIKTYSGFSNTFGQIPITIFSLLYDENGKYLYLHDRLLKQLYDNTPYEAFTLRLGLNSCTDKTRKLIDAYKERFNNIEAVYDNKEQNIPKDQVVRKMYHDKDNPVNTRWVLWIDDDCLFTANDWLQTLSNKITEVNEKEVCGVFGLRYKQAITQATINWMRQAKWYKGKPIKSPAIFPTGGFQVILYDIIKALDWPDNRLSHNGGDVAFGVALEQNGYKFNEFKYGFDVHNTPRRGLSEKFPGVR